MKKIVSVIGTRPQYIKIKPIFDLFKNQKDIEHLIIDTGQHYSFNVSKIFLNEFNIEIFETLNVKNNNEIEFVTECIKKLYNLFLKIKPDIVLVYGDTNSTFSAAYAAYKLNIKVAHIEAGVRGFTKIAEETNRVFVDQVSDIHFCSNKSDLLNVRNGCLSGDLEYELLYNLDIETSYNDYAVMTIHRQSNSNLESIKNIFEFCNMINLPINFYVHHRTRNILNNENVNVPSNINLLDPCSYSTMSKELSECKFILTDSGSIHKTAPFFGKKALIFREEGVEWKICDDLGYSKKFVSLDEDLLWLNDYNIKRNKMLFLGTKMPSQIILEEIIKIIN